MRELHLFAGIGGGILGGMLLGHTPVAAVEIDAACQQVLLARQQDGTLPTFPIFSDVKDFNGADWRGFVDVVCGGFPCQPFSMAGKNKGVQDERHLWPEMGRIVLECEPALVFAENVSVKAFVEPFADLRRMGFCLAPLLCLGAVDVGAPHRRNRWWLLAAHPDRCRREGSRLHVRLGGQDQTETVPDRIRTAMAYSNGARLEERQDQRPSAEQQRSPLVRGRWWAAEPRVGRMDPWAPARVDRVRALGNAQLPQVAAMAFSTLMETL